MTQLARMARHPRDAEIVVVATPPDMAGLMGRFEAARFAPDLRAYLIHEDHVDAFARFARFAGVHVVDERTHDGPAALPEECGTCGQPGSTRRPPAFCPSCGEAWRPVTYEDVSPTATEGTCQGCGHRQGKRFPRCSRCGGAMAYPARGPVPEVARVQLSDPVRLSEVVPEVVDQLQEAGQ